jgi:ubiquinone/menaquinone biosynthesis C-methylase UbiE
MTGVSYDGAAAGWAHGATLVYAPIAALLVARAPIGLAGTQVLDVGAGTGVCIGPLRSAGVSRLVAADLSYDMLAWQRTSRPPSVVCDVRYLPFLSGQFDAVVASFVLNHVTDPVAALVAVARTLRPGGAVLAAVYANSSQSANRDTVDEIARVHGWGPPAWYREIKANATPLLGTATSMRSAATDAALIDVQANEEPVDVHVTEPEALVDYRFGQAQFAAWLAGLEPDQRGAARRAAIAAITDTMEPYRPRVVFLAARTAS